MPGLHTRAQLNALQLNEQQINAYTSDEFLCAGVKLVDLRVRLRNELSGYSENTLISDDPSNDVERQFINDGISQLWPSDWQAVNYSAKVISGNQRLFLPDDVEHVFQVWTGSEDINNNNLTLSPMPAHEGWYYDKSFIDATTPSLSDGTSWIDAPKKALWYDPYLFQIKSNPWIIVRYARKWQPMELEYDCIDPSPNRVQAIIWYACAQYFLSQFQVNTESIRYRNYQDMAKNYLSLFQAQLSKDSKPLYII